MKKIIWFWFICLGVVITSCEKDEYCHCDLDEINHKIDSLISKDTIPTDTIQNDSCIYCEYGLCGKTLSYLYDKDIFFHFYHNEKIVYCSYDSNGKFLEYISYPNEFEYITHNEFGLKFVFYVTNIHNGCIHKLSIVFRNGVIYVTETCDDCKCYGGGYLEMNGDPFVIK